MSQKALTKLRKHLLALVNFRKKGKMQLIVILTKFKPIQKKQNKKEK